MKISHGETLSGRVYEPRDDPSPEAQLSDRENLADSEAGDSVTVRYPRGQIGSVSGASLVDEDLDLLRGDSNEEVAIDQGELHGQSGAVHVPDGNSEIHSQQPSQLNRGAVLPILVFPLSLSRSVPVEDSFEEAGLLFGDDYGVLLAPPSPVEQLPFRRSFFLLLITSQVAQVLPQLSVAIGKVRSRFGYRLEYTTCRQPRRVWVCTSTPVSRIISRVLLL